MHKVLIWLILSTFLYIQAKGLLEDPKDKIIATRSIISNVRGLYFFYQKFY